MAEMAVVEPVGGPTVEVVPRKSGQTGVTDSMVDDALSFLADEPAKPSKKKASAAKPVEEVEQPAQRGPREIALPEDPDEDEPEDEPAHQREDPDSDSDEEIDDAVEHEDQPTVGTKEKPFASSDLPKDRFVEITVDGAKTVVDFAELARGYIGFRTTQRRLTAASELTKRAEEAAKVAQAFPGKIKAQLDALLKNEEDLYEFLLDRDENVLLGITRRMADRVKRFRENPGLVYEDRMQRDQARLDRDREKLERDRQAAEEQARQRQRTEQQIAIFRPGWADGLKKAGFPKLTNETQAKLYEEVILRCNHRINSGKDVTSEDVSEFVVRACKLLELGPAGSAPKQPKPRAPVVERRTGQRTKTDWDALPQSRRLNSADYFLEKAGMTGREFRR